MSARADVLVVGAGIAGLAVAHALRARGSEVLVLERGADMAAQATGRSAAMIRQDAADPAVDALTRRGAALHRSGALGRFARTGSFLIGHGDDDLARHVPAARGRGAFVPDDGVVDVASLVAALASGGAARLGCGVRSIEDGPRVTLDDGTQLAADVVVNAAGAFAGPLGGLPLRPLKRHVALARAGSVVEGAPFAWDDAAGFYFRPHEGRWLLCACDERPAAPGDNEVVPGAWDDIAAQAERLQPGLLPLERDALWAGQRTFAPDRRFVVGWDRRRRGVFWLAGLGGHGLTAAPALGPLAADAILAGRDAALPHLLRPFDPARLLAEDAAAHDVAASRGRA